MRIQAENTASVAAETVEAKAQLQMALARIAELEAALATARNDALEEAAKMVNLYANQVSGTSGWPSIIGMVARIRAMKDREP